MGAQAVMRKRKKSGESFWERVQAAWWLTWRRRAHWTVAVLVLTAATALYLGFLGLFTYLAFQRTPGSDEQAGWAILATLSAVPLGLGASRLTVWAWREWRDWREDGRF